jgi:hypothetical protein
MKIEDVYRTMRQQQSKLLDSIVEIVYMSGNMRGIPQWRDRNRLYKLRDRFVNEDYLLTIKDFQFLESLYYKYKV